MLFVGFIVVGCGGGGGCGGSGSATLRLFFLPAGAIVV